MSSETSNFVSDRCRQIDASGIRSVWALAESMTDPVNFTIGAPDFGPTPAFQEAAIEAIREGFNGYTQSGGIGDLREAVAAMIARELGWQEATVLITSGLSGALLLSCMATLDPGDEAVVPDPHFLMYPQHIRFLGGKCNFVDTYPDFVLDPQKVEQAITPRTKMLFLNSPANPTGAMLTEEQLREITKIARKHDLLVISDEIYWDFSYDHPPVSIGQFYENTLVLRGFSKSHGVPGWRLGYVAARAEHRELIDRMTTLQQYSFVCPPHPFQQAALTALRIDMQEQIMRYKRKRDMICEGLGETFGLVRPTGAFYAFVPAPGGNSTAFVKEAIQKEDVLCIPGTSFSQRDTHFRLSFATSDDQIERGIERLNRLAGMYDA